MANTRLPTSPKATSSAFTDLFSSKTSAIFARGSPELIQLTSSSLIKMKRSQLLFYCIVNGGFGRQLRRFHCNGAAAGKSTPLHPLNFSVGSSSNHQHPSKTGFRNFRFHLDNIKNLDDALFLFDQMTSMRPMPSVIPFTQLLKSVVKLNEHSAAVALYRDFCISGVPVNEYTMNIVINCYCSLGRIDYGFAILSSFFKWGCIPDKVTFGTLLKGVVREGKVYRAQELFKKIYGDKLCELSVVEYNTLIDCLCKIGNTSLATELHRAMDRSKCNGVQDAEDLVRVMIDKGVYPNVVTYSTLMHGYCLRGEMDEARRVFNTMKGTGVVPNICSYNILINGYCKKQELDEALLIFREICLKGLQPVIETFNIILQGLFRVGRCNDAYELYHEIEASGCTPDAITYRIVVDGLCNNRNTGEALKFLRFLRKKDLGVDLKIYNIIIHGLCEAGKLVTARDFFYNLSSIGLQPNVITFTTMINGYCQAGLIEEMKTLLVNMEEKGCLPDSVTYNVIVRGLLRIGEVQEAIVHLENMRRRGFLPDASTCTLILASSSVKGEDHVLLNMMKLLPSDR